MEKLTASLHIALANTFLMYFKAHSYHWNVRGMSFSEHHAFFSSLYEELFDAVDVAAEQIRALGSDAPINLQSLIDSSTIDEDDKRPSLEDMFENLQEANNKSIDSLNKLFELATEAKNQGLADFAASRLDVHAKHGWMLKAHLEE